MILVNGKQITDYPEKSAIRKQYKEDLSKVLDEYGDREYVMVKVKHTPPPDSQGNVYPTPPLVFPLISKAEDEDGSTNTWVYCKEPPELKPNGLWEPKKKSRQLDNGTLLVDMKRDKDFAVYLFTKSRVYSSKFVVVDDPGKEARERGKQKRRELLINSVVWGELESDTELRTIAAAWGINGVEHKEPDLIREELENELKAREDRITKGQNVKGIEAFLDMRKSKNKVRQRSLIQGAIDEKILTYDSKDRRYVIGETEVVTVPVREQEKPIDYLCNALEKEPEEFAKVVKEYVTPAYIDEMADKQGELQWLAKALGHSFQGKKKEEIAKELKDAFCA